MSISLNLYPVLTHELIVKIGYLSTNYSFFYNDNGIEYPLVARPFETNSNEVLLISDERCEWSPDSHNFSLKRNITINNPRFLFGPQGIASESAELGLALLWASKTSNLRGIERIGGFVIGQQVVDLELSLSFLPSLLRGRVQLQTVMYLKTPGTIREQEKHLNNEAGVILGILDSFTIVLDGNGSIFPIVEVSEPMQPLWWVRCDWADPQTDQFDEENVQLCLNSAHSHYRFLKSDLGLKESALLLDIIASSLQIIITKVQESENWDEIVTGKNIEPGSIAHAVNYFLNTFGWDTNSPERLALTIRKDLQSRL